jgi:hypothetical protein
MKFLLLFVVILVASMSAQEFNYDNYDDLLKKVVKSKYVDYSLLKSSHSEQLKEVVDQFKKYSPISNPEMFKTEKEKLVFWINAYNVSILRLINEEYPVESIKKIYGILGVGGEIVWSKSIHNIGGTEYSFNEIEHDIIRKEFKEPRIHFAINCASIGCPFLQNFAFRVENLEEQFAIAIVDFFASENHFRLKMDKKVIYLTSIFDWFQEDFYNADKGETILDYLIKISSNQERKEQLITAKKEKFKIEYIDYNWTLNDTKNQ